MRYRREQVGLAGFGGHCARLQSRGHFFFARQVALIFLQQLRLRLQCFYRIRAARDKVSARTIGPIH